MKTVKSCILFGLVMFALFITACGGGEEGTGTGTFAMSVTDAKPLLPENVTNLFVEFSEIWVHKSGGGWQQLALTESPYTIDLLQFWDRTKTELVPPAILDAGKYTQVRFFVTNATMRMNNDENTDQVLEIPSENLKTDKNFTFNLADGSAIDLIVHFDLSMSVVAAGTGTYQMKPVLHLFEDPQQAAIISGSIENGSFGSYEKAAVIVLDSNVGEYTKVEVEKSTDANPTEFSIFWLVPNQNYTVQIYLLNSDGTNACMGYEEPTGVLLEGGEYPLNGGAEVTLNTTGCIP